MIQFDHFSKQILLYLQFLFMMANISSDFTDKLSLIIKMQKTKFKKRGVFNTLLGYFLLFLIIYVGRQIGIRMWPENVEDKAWFFWKGAVLLHYMAQTWTFLFMLPGYLNWFPSFYQKYKINKQASWPWQKSNWKLMRRKMFYNLIINQVFIFPLFLSFSSIVGVKQRFTNFPSFWEILFQLCIIYFLDDLFFYWGHRTFHSFKRLYKMHKIHHEYDKVFTFTTEYFHPLDYAVANVGPGAAGLMILGSRAHCFTYFFWICYKISLSTEGHSGYEFPWSPVRMLPFVLGPVFHDHHHSVNIGNYSGSCYLWDLLMGTGDHFFKSYLKEEEHTKSVKYD